jgi:diguanylate cyclase (GGDEF)-like protein/PAS domain S-box-containing protein
MKPAPDQPESPLAILLGGAGVPLLLLAPETGATGFTVTSVSPEIETLSGHAAGEWERRGFWDGVLHPEDRAGLTAALAEPGAGLPRLLDHRLRHRDGHYLRVRAWATPLPEAQGGPSRWLLLWLQTADADPPTNGEAPLQPPIAQCERLRRRVLEKLAQDRPLGEVLDTLAREIERASPGSLCSIQVLDAEHRRLRLGAAPSLPEDYSRAVDGLVIGDGVGSCGTAAFRNERVVVEDLRSHPYWRSFRELAAQAGLVSCWSEPIRGADGLPLGTFAIYHRQPMAPAAHDLQLIGEATQVASLAIVRRHSQDILRRMTQAVEQAPVSIVITDTDANIEYVNPYFTRVTGYGREEAIGCNPRILKSGETRPEVYRELWSALKSGGRWEGVFHNRRKDGRLYWEHAVIAPLRDEGGEISHYVAVKQNITARKQAEEGLRESRERFLRVVREMPVLLDAFDAKGNLVFWNRECERVTGYAEAEVVGNGNALALFYPDPATRGRVLHSIRKRAGDYRDLEFTLRCKDGHLRTIAWSNVSAAVAIPGWACWRIGVDITERQRAQQALHQTEERLRLAASVFSHAHEGIVITDAAGNIVEVNDTFCNLTGYPREAALGRNPRFLASGRHDGAFWQQAWHSLGERGYWRGEVWNRRQDGSLIAEMLAISVVRDEADRITHYVGVLADITVLKESQARLEEMAYYDALTHLPNRRLLADRMRQAMAAADRTGRLLAVCYLDLDGFKPVNDNHGHEIGDQLLTSVAARLQLAIRGEDTVARLGGDEFALVLNSFDGIDDAARALDRLLRNLAAPHAVAAHRFEVTASIGVTLYPTDRHDPDTLLRHADQAMYQAKQAGRNRYNFFDAEQDQQVNRHREQLARITEALERGELRLHYQPKVDMRLGHVYGAEALLRWQHPERGLLPPGDFLSLIDGHPLQRRIDHWVLSTGIEQLAQWHRQGLPLSLSLNCSADSILCEEFVPLLRGLLAAHPEIPADSLEMEILETAALEDLRLVTGVIEECSRLGVAFALDDFGTGYSSLTYLRRLPAQILKIDRSFVHDMLQDAEDLAIVEGVIGLARAFQREVVAEGVETALHGALLLQLGCDHAQGFGIARPMPPAELPDWIAGFRPPPLWSRAGVLSWSLDDVPLLTMEAEHRDWVERIAQRLRGEVEVKTPPLDDRQCRFGQWYYDQGQRHYQERQAFRDLEPLHQRVHRIGAELLELYRGNPAGANARLGELFAARDALLDRLHALQRVMVEHNGDDPAVH